MHTSGLDFYSPARVSSLLFCWQELEALAESPHSAHGLIGPDRDRPTPAVPANARQKGRHADPTFWPCIVADLQASHAHLTSGGLGPQTITACMGGLALEDIALKWSRPLDEIEGFFFGAIGKMSQLLEPHSTTGRSA